MKKITDNKIAIFQSKKIRKVEHSGEWWFSVVDTCAALTDSADAGAYWRKLKQRLTEEGSEVVTFCHGLKLVAPDGKMRETDCADAKQYIQKIKKRDAELSKGWVQIVRTLEMETAGGLQKMNCADAEGIFRIVKPNIFKKASMA